MERYNDEELLYLMHCGSEEAERCLYKSYYKQVKKWLVSFSGNSSLGFEIDDYIQEAMMNFSKIIDCYRDDQQTSFKTFMKKSILKRMYGLLPKQKSTDPMDLSSISFDEFITSDARVKYEEIVEDPRQNYRPDKMLTVKETETYYQVKLHKNEATLQCRVMMLKNEGYFDEEISKMLDISIKSVYNAAYRYHKRAQAIDEPK